MSNRDGFAGGFLAGVAIGGVVGTLLGIVLSRKETDMSPAELSEAKPYPAKRQIEGERIETARLSLEDKIAQLNQAIDDVRLQLGSVNGNMREHGERSIAEDP